MTTWTEELARAHAASPAAAESIHDESTAPNPARGDCAWCVLGICWQKVYEYAPGDGRQVIHGRRAV